MKVSKIKYKQEPVSQPLRIFENKTRSKFHGRNFFFKIVSGREKEIYHPPNTTFPLSGNRNVFILGECMEKVQMTDINGNINTMTAAVICVMNHMNIGQQFHGSQLHAKVAKLYPPAKTMYTDTILRTMRRVCKQQYKTVNHNKSIFERV